MQRAYQSANYTRGLTANILLVWALGVLYNAGPTLNLVYISCTLTAFHYKCPGKCPTFLV